MKRSLLMTFLQSHYLCIPTKFLLRPYTSNIFLSPIPYSQQILFVIFHLPVDTFINNARSRTAKLKIKILMLAVLLQAPNHKK